MKEENTRSNSFYAYTVLAIICMIRVAVNWQNKSLGYFTGFHAVNVAPELLSKFEISSAYP